MRNKGRCEVRRLTRPGRVALQRRRYARADGSAVVPADVLIDAVGRLVSLGVRQLACRLSLGTQGFERGAENLEAAAHLALSAETFRQVVEAEGQRVVQAQTHEQLEFDWEAQDCHTPSPQGPSVSRVYVSCDGVMVPLVTQGEKSKRRVEALARRRQLRRSRPKEGSEAADAAGALRPLPAAREGADQKYKEFKIVTLYDQERQHWAVRGTRHDHRHAGRLLRRMAGAVGLSQAQEKVGLVDGADWIANQARRNVPDLDALGLDFHHLSDHLQQARLEVFGEQAPEGWAWMQKLLHTVKHEGYEPFWEGLVSLRTQTRSRRKRAALDGLMHYVAQRREMINYPEHLKRGWDIGSGPMESMCKALTGRLKGRGMRWNADNAEALMALEALMQSRQWDSWWETRYCSVN